MKFWRQRKDEELDTEIRNYIDEAIRDRLARGESPDEARANALREFGNVGLVKEVTRAMWGWASLERLGQDLRFGLRMLFKQPGFTLIAVLTLALGIGVNTALFTGFNLLLRPRPIKDPETIINLERRGGKSGSFSYAEYIALRDQAQSLSVWLPTYGDLFLLGETTTGVAPEVVEGTFVSEHYLSALGGQMRLGRFFSAEENRVAGREAVIVLSHRFWQRRFAGNPNIVGQSLLLNGKPFTVIGVTNPAFVGLAMEMPDLWAPLMMRSAMLSANTEDFHGAHPDWFGDPEAQWLRLHARLQPGRTFAEAQTELQALFSRLPRTEKNTEPKVTIELTPYSGQELRRESVRSTLALALSASGLVLLIACSNLANMLLARTAARQKEIGVRLALGASRSRVLRQLLTESLLLAGLGGVAGALLAWWSCELFMPGLLAHWDGRDFARMAMSVAPDWRVLSFAFLLTLLSGFAFGLIPALRATNPNLIAVIKDDSAAFGGRLARSWLRNGLVVVQVALCLMLLIPAGLLLRGLSKALAADPGFAAKNVLVVFYSLEHSGYDEPRAQVFHQQLQERLQYLPGVAKVSPSFSNVGRATIILPAERGVSEQRFEPAAFRRVSEDYFAAIGTSLAQGRDFTAEEARASAPVVIVSETTARQLWPNENPLGKTLRAERRLRNGDLKIELPAAQVIGIAHDAQTQKVGEIPQLFFYAPSLAQKWGIEASFLVRTTVEAAHMIELARKEAFALEPVLRLYAFTMEESIRGASDVSKTRNASDLTTGLGALALALAALGIYGVLAFSVAQRAREIGIRMALGARASSVQMLVVKQAMRLVALGIAVGLPCAIAVAHVLRSLLLGLSATDPIAYSGVALLLLIVALIASWAPAHRAAQVDPMIALRRQ
ncbi:MAG TPA: ABC transporter permease [Blastocatellia bacterium]|nr:ABC transporter permease [Blastocatellia bacterium]